MKNAEEAGHAASAGFPPFDSSTFVSQIFWLIICFGALYYVLAKVGLPRVAQILDERRVRISSDREEAEKFRAEADKAMLAHEAELEAARVQAREILNTKRNDAAASADKVLKAKEVELKAELDQALGRINTQVTAARKDTKLAARAAASDIVKQLVGKAPAAKALDAAIDKHFN